MKYASILPFTALFALSTIGILVHFDIIPPGQEILTWLQSSFDESLYWIIFLIILLESIIYVGFYFPGQFFAVIIVVGANPTPSSVGLLTLAMVCAATIGSIVNYHLGKFTQKHKQDDKTPTTIGKLLLAMIHINSLAFFMFYQGANNKPFKIVVLAGLFNLPYYLLLIAGTAVLSEQVMAMAENSVMLFSVISIWLLIAIIIDIKNNKFSSPLAK
jgi:membrane-associated protein